MHVQMRTHTNYNLVFFCTIFISNYFQFIFIFTKINLLEK